MTQKIIQNYLSDLSGTLENLSLEKVDNVINLIINAHNNKQQVFIFGNGGSGSTASHFACDINKGVNLGLKKKIRVICLNDNIPVILAYANDLSYDGVFVEQLRNFLNPDDIVIGISGSGNSENILNAIHYSNECGATSIALTGFDGGKLAKIADTSIIVPANDMQKIEDVHLAICHIIMQILCCKLGNNTDG